MTDETVVVDDGQTYVSEETAIIATEAAKQAKQWAEESERQANIATENADTAVDAKDDAVDAKNLAQDWAVKMDGKVNDEDYSAKHYAQQASDIINEGIIATGSTEKRTLQDRFADIINVKDFGAKGDGVTDDTAALQAALDEQAITGAKIFVPTGQYNVQNLTYKSKLEIFGDGNPTSTIVFTGTSGALLSPDTGVNPFGSNISDISFSGSLGTCFVGRTDGSNRGITFENVYINGFNVGIQLSDAFNNSIRDCKFGACVYGINYSSITWTQDSSVTGDIIENCYFSDCSGAGVFTSGAFNNILFLMDIFEGNEKGIDGDSYRASIINCYFERNITAGATLKRGVLINTFIHATTETQNNDVIFSGSGVFIRNNQITTNYQTTNTFDLENDSAATLKTTRINNVGKLKLSLASATGEASLEYTTAPGLKVGLGGTDRLLLTGSGFRPVQDDTLNLGNSSLRWKEFFCANATINTSDERQKQDIDNIDEKVFKAWEKVNFIQYKFKSSVEEKGDNARIHFGLIAQQVKEAFESEGLDGFKYGLLCYDEWDDEYEDVEIIDKEAEYDENGEEISPAVTHTEKKLIIKAGNAYGIRYSEALALECAYQRWKLEQMQKQLDKLLNKDYPNDGLTL